MTNAHMSQLSNNELKGRNTNQISGAWRCLLAKFKEIQASDQHTGGGDSDNEGTDQTNEKSIKKLEEMAEFKESEAYSMMDQV